MRSKVQSLGALMLLAGIVILAQTQCATAPSSGSSDGCNPGGYDPVEFEELVLNLPRYLGQQIAVDGYVVPVSKKCEERKCETASGCCGACSSDAKLAGSPTRPDPSRAFYLISSTGPGVGRCIDSDVCDLKCEPPAGKPLRVLGTIGRATDIPGEAYITVDHYCAL